jgi:ribosome modulation factor
MLNNYPTDAELDDAWNQGYDAFLVGDFAEDNPYDEEEETVLFRAWEDGWSTADQTESPGDYFGCGCDECGCEGESEEDE